ncbi:MAG: hypothetical protein R2728_07240 [Chitinophagales bacterium]
MYSANVGSSTQNLTTYQGCDSIITTVTTLLTSYNYTINDTDCDPANVGSNTQNLTTYQGCDYRHNYNYFITNVY